MKKNLFKKNEYAFFKVNDKNQLVQIKDISIFNDNIEYYILLVNYNILYWTSETNLVNIQNQLIAKILFDNRK